jgi:hypothetical protein
LANSKFSINAYPGSIYVTAIGVVQAVFGLWLKGRTCDEIQGVTTLLVVIGLGSAIAGLWLLRLATHYRVTELGK